MGHMRKSRLSQHKQGRLIEHFVAGTGIPPVKWSAHWDMIVPFLGGLNDGWKARETRRYCAEASSS